MTEKQNSEDNELTEEELLEKMIAEEEAAKADEEVAPVVEDVPLLDEESQDVIFDEGAQEETSEDEPESDAPTTEEQPPAIPEVLEQPPAPAAPASSVPEAVVTTPSGLKFGWQQAPAKEYPGTMHCNHIGIVAAKQQVRYQEIGDEWACTCGQVFEIILNTGGKKTLKAKQD